MNETDIGWIGLAISTILVLVALGLSLWRKLRIEKQIIWASARMTAQLLIVGSALALVFEGTIWWSWLWVVAIVVVAAWTVRRRASEVPNAFGLSLVANGAAAVVTLSVVFGLGVFPLEPRYLVPIAGMMVGNAMEYTIIAARRVVEELREKRPEVEARLALGQPWQVASRPFVRNAIRTALLPQVEKTKAVGIIFLPGLMTGLILAGTDPVDAVRAQAAIMFLILGGVATTSSTVALGLTRRLFTPDHRLIHIADPAASGD